MKEPLTKSRMIQDQIINLFGKGMSLRQTAAVLDVSHQTVKRILDEAGVVTKSVKVYKDAFGSVEVKINQIKLQLSILNQAYARKEITLEELIWEEQKIERAYCRWIAIYEKHQNFRHHKNEIPLNTEPVHKPYEDEGFQGAIETNKKMFYN